MYIAPNLKRLMRKKIELEYVFASSVRILFPRISTAHGLAEWFAKDVRQRGSLFTFVWDKHEEEAELVDVRKNASARFRWLDADDEDEYFEFALRQDPVTEEVALLITDYVDADDEADSIDLWDIQIERLHRVLGA